MFGNPVVQFDEQHLSLANHFVKIDGNAEPVMESFFRDGTEMLELVEDIPFRQCGQEESKTVGPEEITIASMGNDYWIHTTSFQLVDNQMENPLLDGGKSAMDATADAPEDRMKVICATAPRTFLNEDHCVFSDNACSFNETSRSNSGIVCGSPFEVATNPIHPDAGGLYRGSFDVATQNNRTFPKDPFFGQKETVWLHIALNGEDQLRQRMAWALSQILVVSPNSIDLDFQTESFVTYYDIFGTNLSLCQ